AVWFCRLGMEGRDEKPGGRTPRRLLPVQPRKPGRFAAPAVRGQRRQSTAVTRADETRRNRKTVRNRSAALTPPPKPGSRRSTIAAATSFLGGQTLLSLPRCR